MAINFMMAPRPPKIVSIPDDSDLRQCRITAASWDPESIPTHKPAPGANRLGPETEVVLEGGPVYWTGTDGIAGSS